MATRFSDFLKVTADRPRFDDGMIIDSYFNGEIDADGALEQLETEGSTAAPPTEKAPSRVTSYLINFAAHSPEDHDAIITLLEAIYCKEDATTCPWAMRDTHDCNCSSIGFHVMLTANPGMESEIKEADLKSKKETTSEVYSLATRWSNLHEFYAKVEVSKMPQLGLGLSLALLTIEQAHETKSPSTPHLELHAPAASQWFVHAAPLLLAASERGQQSSMRGAAAGETTWRGAEGFGVGRWETWKGRWDALHGREGLSGETAHLARRALVGMEKAERGRKKK